MSRISKRGLKVSNFTNHSDRTHSDRANLKKRIESVCVGPVGVVYVVRVNLKKRIEREV